MGTRADIYIRKEKKLAWIGSIAWDGYAIADASSPPNGTRTNRTAEYLEYLIHSATNERDFLSAAKEYIQKRDDGTTPEMGWPWLENNSKLTEECYVFDVDIGRTLRMMDYTGKPEDHTTDCIWCVCGEDEKTVPKTFRFQVPDMKDKKNIA